MTSKHFASVCFCLVFTSEAAAQSKSETTAQGQKAPATTVVERTYLGGDFMPWRRVQTRSESGGREVVSETLEEPGIEGNLAPTQEMVTATNPAAPNTTQTRRDVFGRALDGPRRLLETTESLRETL